MPRISTIEVIDARSATWYPYAVPGCPRTGGAGPCEMVQHMAKYGGPGGAYRREAPARRRG